MKRLSLCALIVAQFFLQAADKKMVTLENHSPYDVFLTLVDEGWREHKAQRITARPGKSTTQALQDNVVTQRVNGLGSIYDVSYAAGGNAATKIKRETIYFTKGNNALVIEVTGKPGRVPRVEHRLEKRDLAIDRELDMLTYQETLIPSGPNAGAVDATL